MAYEFGLTLDKTKSGKSFTFMPLLYQGEFRTSFPEDVLAETLIRDCRDVNSYYKTFASLSNPLGFIPALCPSLQKDEDYQRLVDHYLNWNFESWQSQQKNKPLEEELSLYISALGDLRAECSNPQPMEKHIQGFLRQKSAKVLLLLGGSGSGKPRSADT